MKTIQDKATRQEIISRIGGLTENSTAMWGKMTVYQMLKHCRLWEEMTLGQKTYKRSFIGRLFGRMALKSVLKDEQPLARNTPTLPEMKITDTGDVAAEKAKWIALIEQHANYTEGVEHPFFGALSREQTGHLAYKHADHHLRQFNA